MLSLSFLVILFIFHLLLQLEFQIRKCKQQGTLKNTCAASKAHQNIHLKWERHKCIWRTSKQSNFAQLVVQYKCKLKQIRVQRACSLPTANTGFQFLQYFPQQPTLQQVQQYCLVDDELRQKLLLHFQFQGVFSFINKNTF